MFNCPHTGVALAALIKLVKRGVIKPSERVVVISTASGLKFIDFKLGYHQKTISNVDPGYANLPIDLPNDYDAVRKAVEAAVSG